MKKITKKMLSVVLALTMVAPMFVFPVSADTTAPAVVTSPAGYSNIEVRVTTDKDPLSYKIGDKVTFTMKVYADNQHISVPMIKYTLEGDGSTALGVDKLYTYGTLTPDANGVFTLTTDVITIPGYMRLEGNIYDSSGTTAWPETPNNDRSRALGAGILVNYDEITTVSPMPEDFEQVWADRLTDLDAVAPKIVRIDKVTNWYSTSTPVNVSSSIDVYAVYLECPGDSSDILKSDDLGNEAGATWAVGYLTVPKNKTAGSLYVSQGYQGYGINTATPSTSTSAISVNMATHSVVLLNNENAATSADYKTKYTSYIKDGTNYGKNEEANSKIETCYFANMLLRDIQMLRFVKQAFGTEGGASLVDENTVINGMSRDELTTAMNYWKGLYNGQVKTSGGSQGGFQAIGVAALEPEGVVSVNANIPWMGDTHTDSDEQRVHGGARPNYADGIRYCDTAFLVRYVKAPLTITAALVDKSCAPNGMIAIWNNFVEARKADGTYDTYPASIVFTQSGTHGYTPDYPGNQKQTLRTYELSQPVGIPNTAGAIGGFTPSSFTDIDGSTADQDALPPSTGYTQVATSVKANATVSAGQTPSFYYGNGYDAYYNAELKKLVIVSRTNVITEWGQHTTDGTTKNANANGSVWHLAYWINENSDNIEQVEYRRAGGTNFSGYGYITTLLKSVKTVKIDNNLRNISWGNSSSTGFFVGMSSLTSAGHGSFAADGSFTPSTYAEGVVDLTAITSTGNLDYALYNCSSVKEATVSILEPNMFENCTSLNKVTVKPESMLTSIGANCFKGCGKLKDIYVEGSLSTLTINSGAFGTSAPTVHVDTVADKTIFDNALEAANITGITVVYEGQPEDGDDTPEVVSPIPQGVPNTDTAYEKAWFSDIDNGEGWIQIGSSVTKATVGEAEDGSAVPPKFFDVGGGRAYYNEALGKLVVVVTSTQISGNYGEQSSYTQAMYDYNYNNFKQLAIANHDTAMNPAKDQNYSADGCTTTWIAKSNMAPYATAYNEAIAAGKTVDEAKDAAGEAVAKKCLQWTKIRNSEDIGSVWKLAYWVYNLAGTITEFELRSTRTASIHSGCYWFDGLDDVETVKICKNINAAIFAQTGVGCFYGMNSVTTIGHGEFASDGTFTPTTYVPGIANLTALSGSTAEKLGWAFLNNKGVRVASVPRIDKFMFSGATNVEKIIVPADFTVTTFAESAFSGASALEYIEILGTVDPAFTVGKDVFTNTSGVTVVVNTAEEKGYVDAALSAASVTGVEVITAENYIKVPTTAVKADSFSVKMKETTGLRALFTFDETIASTNRYEGFTLVSYGVFASSYDNFINTYNGDENALFEAARLVTDNEGSKIKFVPVYKEDGTGVNRYVDYDSRTFCVALTGIPAENSLSDIYMAGYAVWRDGQGRETVNIVTYEMPDAMKAVNLYEITLGLAKKGIINSKNTDKACFLDTLKAGALTTKDFTAHTNSAINAYNDFLNEDGTFTYWNVDYRKYTGATASGWGYDARGIEETATTGVQWSIVQDGEGYIVILSKDSEQEGGNYILPTTGRSSSKQYYAPFHYQYGDTVKVHADAASGMKVYSPAISKTLYEKITTVIVDDGIVAFDEDALCGNKYITTFVFPESLVSIGQYAISSNDALKDIIWTGDPDAKEKYGVEHLYDLRGVTTRVHSGSAFNRNSAAVNIVTATCISGGTQLAFASTTNLERYWSADVYTGYTMPEAGVIDLRNCTVGTIDKGFFDGGTKIKTIIVPATMKSRHNTFSSGEDDRSYAQYGRNKTYNFQTIGSSTNFVDSLKQYITDLHAAPKNTAYADGIFVNGVSVKTLFPELYTTAQ